MKEKIRKNKLVEFKNIYRLHQDWSSCPTVIRTKHTKRTPLSITTFFQSKRSAALFVKHKS